ncbi:glycosyltransferase family 4 protein [Streptomyces sp. NPDC051664]|uniref:glycosyltransferase family 4 protein n=1 Tax=Streptomyces sp. NPDC051664 TaxID=3365668 RepID=UPI00379F0A93
MKIVFLINNGYGIGGTIRSTVNLSAALADRHDVEVVSVHRVADEPALPLDPRVTLTPLIDMREDSPTYDGTHPLTHQPCTMFPDTGAAANSARLPYSALQDERIGAFLQSTDADVVIATRPDLNGYLARDGQHHYLRIGQEHLSLDAHNDRLREHQNAAVTQLDAFVTVSEADAAQYRTALPNATTTIVCVPNGVPTPATAPSTLESKLIVAAGRLVEVKRYDRLIAAFAKVTAEHPDWTLRIYGRGPEKTRLRQQIEQLGLHERAFLMGTVSPIETEWAKGAIAAVSSDMESFGMTIVEAMHCGVPVVATDCPHGPGEIITHGADGLLVPLSAGSDGHAQALKQLITDDTLRRRLGAAARSTAATYEPFAIARRYEELIGDLTRKRRRTRTAYAALLDAGRALQNLKKLPQTLRVPRTTPATAATTTVSSDAALAPQPAPAAHARATVDGGMSVVLELATLPPGPLDFVMRLRRDLDRREVRIPVPSPATSSHLKLEVPLIRGEHHLAEGRWDCYIAPRGTNQRRRLLARLVEQAHLVAVPPHSGPHGASSWIPYTTSDGFLALRTWLRAAHAEVTHLVVSDHEAHITATLHGDVPLPTAENDGYVSVIARSAPAEGFRVPVHTHGDSVHFAIPHHEMFTRRHADHDLWDLHLHPTPTAPPIAVGRIGGDIADRKKTDIYPAVLHQDADLDLTRLRPYYTHTNDLSFSLRTTPLTADGIEAAPGPKPVAAE